MDLETFTANFALLADTANGISKLRGMILQLAVMGKLVPQDPKDEPATVLLQKIAGEKERLIPEGTIKRSKPLPPLQPHEVPYELPESWVWTRLDDLACYIQRGKGPKYVEKSDVPVISQKCIQWSGFQIDVARFIDPDSLDKYQSERFLRSGDLLWNSTGTGTIGRINVYNHEENPFDIVVADSHLTVVRPVFVDSYYIYSYIASPVIQEGFEERASGTTNQIELNTAMVRMQIVPVPPLAEQKRIVAKVDELMALCDELEERQKKRDAVRSSMNSACLHELTSPEPDESKKGWIRTRDHFDLLYDTPDNVADLRKSIFQLAVMGKLIPQNPSDEPASVLLEKIAAEKARLTEEGKIKKQKKLPEIGEDEKPFEIPSGWEWARPDDFSQKITDGEHFRPPTQDKGVYFLSAKDIRSGGVSLDDPLFISEETAEKALQRCNPEIGDLLVVSRGATVGRMCTVDIEDVFCLLGSVILIKPLRPMLSEYLKIVMKTPQAFDQLVSASGSTAQPAIYLRDIKKIVFPIAPLAEQHRIVAKVDQLMGLCEKLQSKLEESRDIGEKLMAAVVNQVTMV